jgi:dTDP-glucose 4,6-dehydratase
MNCFVERQHPEKFVPATIRKILAGEKVTIHGDSTLRRYGTRYWIHARTVADAVLFLLERGEFREKYNVVGEIEVNNLAIAEFIAQILKRPLHHEMVDCNSARPGHDFRYGLDGEKMRLMGWKRKVNFHNALIKTVQWFVKNPRWLDAN